MSEIEKSIQIAVPIEKVWAALTVPDVIGDWMSDDAVNVDLKIGGRYAFFNGETTGKFVEIEKPVILEYTWRQNTWLNEWPDSVVRWEMRSVRSGTHIHLIHSKFPTKEEQDSHDEGWDLYWLEPMTDWLESEG